MNMRRLSMSFTIVFLPGILLAFTAGGCVERSLSIASDPPGALVYLNDQEIGRTPLQREFTWYGNYEVIIRKDGYQAIKTTAWVVAPIYEWVPLDLVAELLPIPLKDHRTLHYTMQPDPPPSQNDAYLLDRASELRGELESSHQPPARPTTRP
jgi:hypothetical protein